MNREFKNLKIDASDIKKRVNKTINADLLERRMYMKHKILKASAIAASLAVISAVSVFAMTPAGQAAIGNIISYFQNDRAQQISSFEELAKYNSEIGVSASENGYTLTLDNVASDDNYVHVFYTFTADSTPFYEGREPERVIDVFSNFSEECQIDGRSADLNHNEYEGYFLDSRTYKGAAKYNVSGMEIPDNFTLGFSVSYAPSDDSSKTYAKISLSSDIDKSKVKVNTVTREINLPLWNEHNIAEKVILSPFGNQLVIKSKGGSEDLYLPSSDFALFDQNGTALDILNTDLCGTGEGGVAVNSFEFLKAGADTKSLTFVPVTTDDTKKADDNVIKKIGSYPIEFELSDYGKVIVTDVRVSDSVIEIDYYNDGFIMFDPEFDLLSGSGNSFVEALLSENTRCLYDVKVNHQNNSYTAKYLFYNEDDNTLSSSEKCSSENLSKQLSALSLCKQDFLKLDFDKSVTVDIK